MLIKEIWRRIGYRAVNGSLPNSDLNPINVNISIAVAFLFIFKIVDYFLNPSYDAYRTPSKSPCNSGLPYSRKKPCRDDLIDVIEDVMP